MTHPTRPTTASAFSLFSTFLSFCVFCGLLSAARADDAPLALGSRLELFVDDYLIQSLDGGARQVLHSPQRREIVFRTDAAWEGNGSAYQSVFKDGALYRMYYRGLHYRHSGPAAQELPDHAWYLCYAESDDGVHWRRPELGIVEFNGSKANNIVLSPELLAEVGGDPAHSATFLDTNPACPPAEKYKIIILGSKPKTGLYALVSADGLHFTIGSREPLVTEGAFDSQNLAFWDPVREEYREYHRGFNKGVRDILTASAKAFGPFPPPQYLSYPGAPAEHLYTNQVQPYFRAPQLLMGFPMRYTDRGWSEPVLELPGLDERRARIEKGGSRRYGTAITDALLMTSRDGLTFSRWPQAFIRPGPRRQGSWVYGDNFVFWGMVPTASDLGDAPVELSFYATENYWEGVATSVRRYTLRLDGFVSVQAPLTGGELLTRLFSFSGGNLALNYETSGAGSVQVELQDAAGKPLPGYTVEDCPPLYGDSVRQVVRWRDRGGDLRELAGKPLRLRFVLKDADLYALQFVPYEPDPPLPAIPGLIPRKNAARAPGVVFSDDLAGPAAGVSGSAEDLDPRPASEATGWQVLEGSPDRVQVLNDEPPGSGKAGTNAYLLTERRDEVRRAGGCLWLALGPQEAADAARGGLDLRLKLYLPAGNASPVDIDGYDGPPEDFTGRSFQVRLLPNGEVNYYDGEQNRPVEGLVCPRDTWVPLQLEADLGRGVFALQVGGKKVEGIPFAAPLVQRVQAIYLGPNSSRTRAYLDDVSLAIRP